MYTCECPEGYFGKNCEITPCFTHNCANGSECRNEGATWACTCLPGYSGRLCDISPCDSYPCQNNASCEIVERNGIASAKCNCLPGFSGELIIIKYLLHNFVYLTII